MKPSLIKAFWDALPPLASEQAMTPNDHYHCSIYMFQAPTERAKREVKAQKPHREPKRKESIILDLSLL